MAPPKTGAEKGPAPVGGKVIFKSNTESSRLHPLCTVKVLFCNHKTLLFQTYTLALLPVIIVLGMLL